MTAISRRLLALLIAATSVVRLDADTITLNTGEKLDGKIVGETETEITIEVKISAGVIDERTISKSEIREMERETADDVAYQQIKQTLPGPSSLATGADYDRILETLNNFTKQFPASSHNADVARTVQEFESEKSRVAAGECKYGGTWLSKEEFEKRKPEIMAGQLYETMKNLSAAGDLVGAMNALDQIEKKYPGSGIYPDAIDLGKRVLPILQASIDQRMQKLKYDMDEWKKGVEITSEPKRSQLITAFNDEQLRYDSAIAAAEKSGVKWKPLIPRSEKSLQGLLTQIPNEKNRLAVIDLAKPRQSIQLAAKASQSIAANDLTAAESDLNQAKTLWPANASVALLQTQLAALKAKAASSQPPASVTQAAQQRAAAVAAQKPTPAAEPGQPFYKTPKGALLIVLGVVVVVGGISLAGRLVKPLADEPKP